MKVLIFHYAEVSGNGVHAQVVQVSSYADALRRRGATVAVCARRMAGRRRSAHDSNGGALRSLVQPFKGYGLKALARNLVDLPLEASLIKKHRPDVIVVWFGLMGFSAFVASKLMKIPSVAFMDGPITYLVRAFYPHRIPSKLPEFIEKTCCDMAHSVITQSEVSKAMLSRSGVDPCTIRVCPNGVDLEMFRPLDGISEVRKGFGWQDKFVFGFLGAFQTWHNPEELTWVIKELAYARPKARFLLVGDGPYKKQVQEILRQYRLMGCVHMTGNVTRTDLLPYLHGMDASLAPFVEYEFFFPSPMKVLESMAAGVPVLTTAQGELIHLIDDSINGFLYECGHRGTLLQKALSMIDNPEKCRHMGLEARRRVAAERSWDRISTPLWESLCLAARGERKL